MSGGRTASTHAEPRGLSTRCATRCAYLRFASVDGLDWPSELGDEKRLFGTASLA